LVVLDHGLAVPDGCACGGVAPLPEGPVVVDVPTDEVAVLVIPAGRMLVVGALVEDIERRVSGAGAHVRRTVGDDAAAGRDRAAADRLAGLERQRECSGWTGRAGRRQPARQARARAVQGPAQVARSRL